MLSETLACPINVSDISMDEEAYQRRATASMVEISGDIEGRVIFDVEDSAAMKVASSLAGMEMESDPQLIRETVAELANLVIGNAVTSLNDQGFRFRVHPPVEHAAATGFRGSENVEALVMDFASPRRQHRLERRHPLQSPPPQRLGLQLNSAIARSQKRARHRTRPFASFQVDLVFGL